MTEATTSSTSSESSLVGSFTHEQEARTTSTSAASSAPSPSTSRPSSSTSKRKSRSSMFTTSENNNMATSTTDQFITFTTNPYDYSYLPPHATPDLRAATIYIRDPHSIEPVYNSERRRAFQALVRRYMNQLIYGCRKKTCTTPTCYTARKALARGGVGNGRKFTVLSARIIASHLATREDPYSALCDGRPAVPVMNTEEKEIGKGRKEAVEAVDHGLKDTKSFTQQLFDSRPLKMIQWLGIPPPASVFRFAPEGWKGKNGEEPRPEGGGGTGRMAPPPPPFLGQKGTGTRNKNNEDDRTALDEVTKSESLLGSPEKVTDSFAMAPPPSITHMPTPTAQKRRNSIKDKLVTPTPHSNMRSRSPPSTPNGPPPIPHHHRHHRPPVYHQPAQQNQPPPTWAPFSAPHLTTPSRTSRQGINNVPQKDQTAQAPSAMSTFSAGLQTPSNSAKQFNTLNQLLSPSLHYNTDTDEYINPPQALSHLNPELIVSLFRMVLDGKVPASQRVDADIFAKQSIFYVLSTSEAFCKSFCTTYTANQNDESGLEGNASHGGILDEGSGKDAAFIDYIGADKAFRLLLRKWEPLVFNSLWKGLEEVYRVRKVRYEPSGEPPPKPPPAMKKLGSREDQSTKRPERPSDAPPNPPPPPPNPTLDNLRVAKIIVLSMQALAAMLPREREGISTKPNVVTEEVWTVMRISRGRGWITNSFGEAFDHPLAERLMSRITRCLEYRIKVDKILRREGQLVGILQQHFIKSAEQDLDQLRQSELAQAATGLAELELRVGKGWTLAGVMVDWAKSLFLKNWEGKEEVEKGTIASGALMLMSIIYNVRKECFLGEEIFETPVIADRFEPKLVGPEWFKSTPTPEKSLHLLDHLFLFHPSTLVTYFRSINLSQMTTAYEGSLNTLSLIRQVSLNDYFLNSADTREQFVYNRLKIATSTYLLFCVRRETLLQDAFNLMYKREIRELKKPLKVKFINQGEEGLDQGGPQQEFFNVLIKEVLRPDYGMFTTDPVSHFNWFAVCPTEPIHKYELLGALVGVAIYNGITLPMNFPRVMYLKLLGYKTEDFTLEDIEDGWGPLVQGLRGLLEWEEGDVEDVFMRTYDFSYELPWGGVRAVNMIKAKAEGREVLVENIPRDTRLSRKKVKEGETYPDPDDNDNDNEKENIDPEVSLASSSASTRPARSPSVSLSTSVDGPHSPPSPYGENPNDAAAPEDEESPLVTNRNRHAYVRDYISWLTDLSIRRQYTAFAHGFHSIIHPCTLTLFTPPTLQSLLEGTTEISIPLLEAATKYDEGYHANHPTIKDFWSIVRGYSPEKRRQLLEFVTASDRIPSNGIGSVVFVVQRSGGDSDRVPTSMTCFGRLLLPEYASRRKMREKLRVALENGRGFGVP